MSELLYVKPGDWDKLSHSPLTRLNLPIGGDNTPGLTTFTIDKAYVKPEKGVNA